MKEIVIYWSRRDFRLNDNPALYNAVKYSEANNLDLLNLFILDSKLMQKNVGYPRKKYLSIILSNFSKIIPNFNIINGDYNNVFDCLSSKYKINLFLNDDIEPYAINRDNEVKKIIENNGGRFNIFKDQVTIDLNSKSGAGNIYSVFTPFRKANLDYFMDAKICDVVSFERISRINFNLDGLDIIDPNKVFELIDGPNILKFSDNQINLDEIFDRNDIEAFNLYKNENEALARLEEYIEGKLLQYKIKRDSLSDDAKVDGNKMGQTSRMSIALKWGLVSPRYIKNQIVSKYNQNAVYKDQNIFHFISELMWREFYKYILFHNPEVLDTEYQTKYRGTIEWEKGENAKQKFISWIKGQTGYKLVDACMGQIEKTYYMHNRARMIVSSILTKNLGIDWRWGQEYFRMMLLDLDEASNNGGWQWGSSTGADPKPIRIFNPYLQERYDEDRRYRDLWLNLKKYKSPDIPLVEHNLARSQALVRYKSAGESYRDY